MKNVVVETLPEFIARNGESKTQFAARVGIYKQEITKWQAKNYIVVDGVLCRQMRDFNN
tara:strand:- start:20028 stop:20204 length:177 start_codon:yes stop_codon:yes gene_type:complete